MGAQSFIEISHGHSATDAFARIVADAKHEFGHGGYTGSIAEKTSFVMIRDTPEQVQKRLANEIPAWTEAITPAIIPDALLVLDDARICCSEDPAGCIDLGPDEHAPGQGHRFLFFGYARSLNQ